MLNFLFQLVPTVIILGILIFIHELGHYLACIWSGVRVEKFSIGFGPELFKWQRNGTVYALSAIPFGGFVKPSGESFAELEGNLPKQGDFLAASKPKRFLILIAGIGMNYILAILLLIAVFWGGHPVLKAKVGGFVKDFPAEASGLKIGDEIKELNGRAVQNWQHMTMLIFENKNPDFNLKVVRDGEELNLTVQAKPTESTDETGKRRKISRMGISPANEYMTERFNFSDSVKYSLLTTVNLSWMTYKSLWYVVTGQMSAKSLSGPIGIMVMTGQAAKSGMSALLQLTALISISLAVINLLPIPALDGGHIFFLLLGVIMRKEVSPKIQDRMTQVGFAFLMALMVFVIFNDLNNIGIVQKVSSLFQRT